MAANVFSLRDSYGAGVADKERSQLNQARLAESKTRNALAQRNQDLAEAQYSDEQKMANTQRLLAGVRTVKANPNALGALLPELAEAGILNREAVPQIMQSAQADPQGFLSTLDNLESQLMIAVGEQPQEIGKSDLVTVQGEGGPQYVTAQDAVGKAPVNSTSSAKPPASIAEYNLYRQQVRADGQEPMSFYDFRRNISEQESAGRTAGAVTTKADIEAERERPQKIMAARSTINQIDNTIGSIDDAIGMSNWWSTGPTGQILQGLGATDARDLKAKLTPIVASLAFDRLQAMRDASKTGGALGQVSERELDLLSGSIQSLDTAQSTEAIISALKKVRGHYENIRRLQRGQEALLSGAKFAATPQEAAQLPPGTTFVDPDGVIRRVPGE